MKELVLYLVTAIVVFACKPAIDNTEDIILHKIDSLISLMTLEEKINMLHASSSFISGGVERLGIPELIMSDGPHGVRMEHGRDWVLDTNVMDSVTYLPTSITLAATWNKELGCEFGEVLGSEASARGKDIILGPGLNIIRTPLNGRNFEYLSEDPYLTSQMVVGYIKGVQEQGIAACAKHYIANNQETNRNGINVKMSNRTFREIYLPGFAATVKEAEVLSVMGAYNKFRGEYCSHNDFLVNQILKKELGFKGPLISDWAAVHNTKEAAFYGTDIEMGTDLDMLPHPDYSKFYMADSLLQLVKAGIVPDSLINDKVKRVLWLMFKAHKFDIRKEGEINTTGHQNTARKIAEEGIVLLKNERMLPLDINSIKTLAVIGENAIRKHGREGGSSQVKPYYEITPLEGLKNLLGDQCDIKYARGFKVSKENKLEQGLIQEAVEVAKKADVALIFGGWIHNIDNRKWGTDALDAEGLDKPDMQMPFYQNELIKAVLEVNPNTVVVLFGGGAIDMNQWIGQTKAVMYVWYPGMEGGNAIADVLFGKVNPSGKLPVTFPKKLEDHPAHKLGEYPGQHMEITYKDDIYVGYRYFETYQVEPLFCFGHGLSYTQFEYTNLKIKQKSDHILTSIEIANIGDVHGAEVVQLYISKPESSINRSSKELKGFNKVFLAKDEKKTITFSLNKQDFSYYYEQAQKWVVEPGKYQLLIGSSSKDIRVFGTITW